MTQPHLIASLRGLQDAEDDKGSLRHCLLEEAIAVLSSCACGEREPILEGWLTPNETGIDGNGNGYVRVYLSGRHSEADGRVIVLPARDNGEPR